MLKTPQKYNKFFFYYSDNYSQHWTEILQPAQAVHLIGNKSSIQRLSEWLEEWKKLIQSEAGKKIVVVRFLYQRHWPVPRGIV